MRMLRYLAERLENDWIASCDTRLCEFNHVVRELDDDRITRRALQSPSFSQQLGNFTSSYPIATVSAAIDHAFKQQREAVPRIVLKKPTNAGHQGNVPKVLLNQMA